MCNVYIYIYYVHVAVLEGSYFRNSWYNKNVFKLLSKQTHIMRILLMFNERYDKDRYDDNSIILLFELICDFPLMGQFCLLVVQQTNR